MRPDQDVADEDRVGRGAESPAATDLSAADNAPVSEESAEMPDVATLRRERDDLYDRLLRKTAEFDNYRKRVERERREQADQTITELLRELLLVADDFDLALSAEHAKSLAGYKKGVELIHTKLHDLLRKHGVRPIEAIGGDFDPNLHQAVMHESSPEHRDGEVIGELRRGYMIGDRLLRPSMVKVAKA
jgi:molecular chaperone GrpE